MRPHLLLMIAATALAACGERPSEATFTCPNGPDLTVAYTPEGATLYFPDGRAELLPRPDPERPNHYEKPGYSWSVGMRDARLYDRDKSYLCDQMSG